MKLARRHRNGKTYCDCAWSLNYITDLTLCEINEFKCLLLLVGMDNKRLLLEKTRFMDDLMTKKFKGWPVSSIILFIFRSDDSRKILLNESICLVNSVALFIVLNKAFFYLSRHNSRPKLLYKKTIRSEQLIYKCLFEFS